ncbi:TonB-dependent receptor plug domain-containing protein [Falsiroseomonas sp. CW058]|uniref:TonB-dependent receptor plug domain-containing protein n=1 Tax=Falsiroseomonas sp. CW058 TaxID=3388664 RepID=UPI003D32264C
MRRSLLLATSALALAFTPAHAQQALPETIVTATRIPTEQARVPAAVTVLTRQDIEERGWRSLAEALATVPGMRLVQGGGLGQQASAFLRGSNSRHVLVLLDGVPVNDPSEPNGAFNFGNEMLGDIERIEVVRGPGSSLYGSGAIGGVVNMITRRAPMGTPARAFGDLAAGSNRTLRGVLGLEGTTPTTDFLVVGQSMSSRGSDATAPRFNANTGEREGFTGAAGTARLGWAPVEGSRVEGLLRWRENGAGLDNIPRDDPNNEQTDRRLYGQLRGETALLGGAWTTGLRAAVTEDRRRNVNLPDGLNPTRTDDLFRGTRQVLDWGNRVRLGDLGPLEEAGIAFGATHERESSDSQAGSPPFRTSVDATARNTAFHAGAQARVLGRLDLSAGLRQDLAEDYDGFTSWQLGAVLALPEAQSRLRASAGTAFKAPSLYQRFGRIGTSFRGNPDLSPERSFAWEVGGETDIPLFGRDDGATLGATWFDTRFRDLINFNAAFSTLENVERARARGAELSLVLRPMPWLDASAAWTVTETRDEATGRPLPRRPRNVLTLAARVAPTDRLVIAPELLFTGPSPEGAFAAYDNTGRSFTSITYNKAGTVLNLTGSYRVSEGITAYAEGRNLTGSRFEPANGFVVPGRSLLAGARFTF